MAPEKLPQLDPIIHSRVRLAILSVLVSVEKAEFSFLKETIDTTDGNLSTHLSKLEQAGFVAIEKTFIGKKPLTRVSITETGKDAFSDYIEALESVVKIGKK